MTWRLLFFLFKRFSSSSWSLYNLLSTASTLSGNHEALFFLRHLKVCGGGEEERSSGESSIGASASSGRGGDGDGVGCFPDLVSKGDTWAATKPKSLPWLSLSMTTVRTKEGVGAGVVLEVDAMLRDFFSVSKMGVLDLGDRGGLSLLQRLEGSSMSGSVEVLNIYLICRGQWILPPHFLGGRGTFFRTLKEPFLCVVFSRGILNVATLRRRWCQYCRSGDKLIDRYARSAVLNLSLTALNALLFRYAFGVKSLNHFPRWTLRCIQTGRIQVRVNRMCHDENTMSAMALWRHNKTVASQKILYDA